MVRIVQNVSKYWHVAKGYESHTAGATDPITEGVKQGTISFQNIF